ncbi:MAG: small basic protein [Planctomycetes bacterium]|nr:small basic protein [Planctomycetota bacterium]
MSLHRSLKTKPAALNQHRNVLTRAERIAELAKQDRFDPEADSPLSLVKVANRQVVTKKKKKEEEEGATEATTEGGEDTDAAAAAAS